MEKYFVDVDGLFYVCKMMEIHHQIFFSYIINIYIYIYWIRFIVISNIELKKFQINLMLELFMCLKLE